MLKINTWKYIFFQFQKTNNYLPSEKDLLWSDACIVVYSLTDPSSYRHAWRIVQHIQRLITNLPILILANKADLAPTMGCVDTKEALALAEACQCQFAEVSAAEGCEDVERAFLGILMEARGNVLGRMGSRRRRLSFRTVSKALTAVFGRRNNTLWHVAILIYR